MSNEYEQLLPYASAQQRDVLKLLADGLTHKKVADKLGIDKEAVHNRVSRARKKAQLQFHSPEHHINHPVPDVFEAKGLSQLVDERTGKSVLTWYKSGTKQEERLAMLIERMEEHNPSPAPEIPPPQTALDKDLLTLYTLTDFHLGMYAWEKETGDNWDTKVASKVLLNGLSDMMDRSPNSEKGVLNIQGDFLHWDGLDSITPTSHHILDADTRFGNMVDLSMDLIEWAVQMLLRKHSEVIVFVCEGNHDMAGSCWLRKHLLRIFRENLRVTVDDTEFPFYALKFGKVFLGFHHGHKKKNADLPFLFASEPRYRKLWGSCTYSYIHTGHYHHSEKSGLEDKGAVVERHPTLSARDAYAARGGYVSQRKAHAITYHCNEGEISRVSVTPREK